MQRKINVSKALMGRVTRKIFNPEPTEITLNGGTKIGSVKPEYDNLEKSLTIKYVSSTGYKMILEDGSKWTLIKENNFRHTYKVDETVKVFASDLQGLQAQGTYTIVIQGKNHDSDHWHFEGFAKG